MFIHPARYQSADWHAAVLLGRSSGWMNIGQPSHGRRPLVEHGWPSGARVLRYPTAGSHHSYGVDSITRRFRADGIMKVFFNDCQASNQCAQRGDRDDLEVRDGKNIWKVPPRWSALYSAWHWHSSWEPRLVLRAKESNNQKVWRGIKQSKSHKYHYPIPLVFRIKTIKIPGKSR